MSRDIRSSYPHSCHYQPPRPTGHRAAIVPTATRSPSAATTQTATPSQGPNPLWAINIGMGVFWAATALIVILG
jgi:hypothetical protein